MLKWKSPRLVGAPGFQVRRVEGSGGGKAFSGFAGAGGGRGFPGGSLPGAGSAPGWGGGPDQEPGTDRPGFPGRDQNQNHVDG